jgi:hypothetical protein
MTTIKLEPEPERGLLEVIADFFAAEREAQQPGEFTTICARIEPEPELEP